MAVPIKLPDMGTNVGECRVQRWLVQEGGRVMRGMALAEIETDKAVAELESTAEGVLLRHVVTAGEAAQIGDILAYVGQPGEVIPEASGAAGPRPGSQRSSPRLNGARRLLEAREPKMERQAPEPRPADSSQRVSPIVRNLAAKLGIDLTKVEGTGAGGMITREDVLRASGK